MRAGKHMIIMQIFGIAVLNAALLFYYLYLNQNQGDDFFRMLLGGIGLAESSSVLNVVIYVFPDFIFCHCICCRYIRQLKENYVYIFVREKNMKRWLKKFSVISFLDILIYKVITVIILFLAGMVLQEKLVIQPGGFMVFILCQCVRLAMIVVFCNLLLLKFDETVSIYANLLVQALPLFLAGVLYDMDGAWEAAVTYIPVNWCNCNYLAEIKADPVMMLCLSAVFGWMIYLYSEKLFQDFETI